MSTAKMCAFAREAGSGSRTGRARRLVLYISAMAQPTKSVLWVDDEAELLEPHRMFLRDKGFDVEMATNADDALEMVRRRPYDIVLLDEQMPGKNGLEVLSELRETDHRLPVVMVTKS